MKSEILDEKRKITCLYYNDTENNVWTASNEIKIRAYGEPGPHCYTAFYAVEKNGEVIARIPATMVEVQYVRVVE